MEVGVASDNRTMATKPRRREGLFAVKLGCVRVHGLLAVLIMVAACSKPAEDTPTPPRSSPPPVASPAPARVATVVNPVPFEALQATLPELSGWTRYDVRGETTRSGTATSRAEAHYRNDRGEIELEIVDTAFSQILLAPISMFLTSGYDEKMPDGFKHAAAIGGQPGFEEWHRAARTGEITQVAGGRFVVHARGREVTSIDPVRRLVEAVDTKALLSLK